MITKSMLTRIACVLIAIVLAVSFSLTVFAAAEKNKTLYVKDVKLINAKNIETATKLVPEGYTLLPYDLNDGTGNDDVYMVYSTTQNPDEAITDIKMMNMNGGFVYSDYEKELKNVKDSVKELANDVKISAQLFAENYVKGTYGAKAAYRALSVFTVDEAGGQPLSDYIIYGNPSDEFYIKLVLNVHKNVLSTILSALTMAVQGEKGDTWLDRLSKIEDPDPDEIEELPDYWDKAEALGDLFISFYDIYGTIDHDYFRNGNNTVNLSGKNEGDPTYDASGNGSGADVSNNGSEALYELAYMTLEQYSFGNGTKFSEWFVSEELCEDYYFEMLYSLIQVLTPEEYAMMRLAGPITMIFATAMDERVYNDYVARVDEATNGQETCSLWVGINAELLRSSIGVTDTAARAIAETEFEEGLLNDGDGIVGTGLRTAGLVAACGMVALGVGIISYYVFGSIMLSCFSGSAALLSSAAVVGTVFGAVLSATGIGAIVVAIVVALVFIVIWIVKLVQGNDPEYTDIPKYMYDYVTDKSGNTQFILYEGVKFQDDRIADVNVWGASEWHAMYVSHDKSAGAPIEADFKVKYADGRIDEGYAGLASFGYVNAENLNQYDDDDDVDGVYVTYRQEDLDGDYARGKYLSNVKIFRDKNPDLCKLEIKNQNFTLYDYNLTPDTDYYTYLGYQTTNRKENALTDIRIVNNYSSTQYAAGGGNATYAASGVFGEEDSLTLYATSISLFGTPILSDFLVLTERNAPAGYEPVNFFCGGPAVDLNMDIEKRDHEKRYFYFLPSTTYTGGEEYLGGIATVNSKSYDNNSLNDCIADIGFKVLKKSSGDQAAKGEIVYYTTHNPYRAIYNVTAVTSGGEMGELFTEFFTYDGIPYSLAPRFLATDKNTEFDERSREEDSRLYISGIRQGATPMKVADIYATTALEVAQKGFIPVSGCFSSDGMPADLSDRFTNSNPIYLYVRGTEYKEGKYLTSIYITSKETILGDIDADCSDLDNSHLVSTLAALGAHNFVPKNLNLKDGDNATYMGYTKDKDATVQITNLILYYAGETDKLPESKKVFGGITYHRISEVDLFCKENGVNSSGKRVYLYYTTNPAAGKPIIDIQIDNNAILNGWETVRTQNQKALYADMDAHSSNMWFIHMKREVEEPKYISEIVIGIGGNAAKAKAALLAAGCDYMLDKDLNDNVGALSNYIYLGYKRTNDPNKAIRDLRTTHDNEVDSFVKNGATYYKIDGNLNFWTNLFADDIFLYYTMDEKAGTPITSLGTSASVANWSHGEGNRYVVKTVLNQKDKPSDLNDGAAGDYIYLLQTRDKEDSKGTASMIGGGSIAIICAFLVVFGGTISWVCIAQKKRVKAGITADNSESNSEETN